jgi:putative ATPase
MRSLGYGDGYKYAHDHVGARVDQDHLPSNLEGRRYYMPTDRGWEGRVTQAGEPDQADSVD